MGVASGIAAPACCVAATSRVRTPTGLVPIGRLRLGDEVLSFDHERGSLVPTRVRAIRSAMRACLSVRSGGSTLVCTPDHPVYMPDSRSYDHAVAATPGRALVHASGRLPSAVAVDAVASPGGLHRVVDITVESQLHNFVAEDIVVHNKDIDDCTYGYAEPAPIRLDEQTPMRRILLRVCNDGNDVRGALVDLDLSVTAEGRDVRVAAYFDAGDPIVFVDGVAPFRDELSATVLEQSCSAGIPLVVERLDGNLSSPATVSIAVDVQDCAEALAEVTVDVEVVE